ncbi:MAG TPA: type II secretion system protein [Polyangiaceae bacterium]|nr:type II secretion system protein [Polyangiaceae bacterium]
MVTKLKNLKRGFTLVELMIVVAIVGILAALAIYGVSKYVSNAKSAEARNALGRMAKDAVSAYQKEAMSATVLALGASSSLSHRLCGSATNKVPLTVPAGEKYQSKPSEWGGTKDIGWTCLKFSMDAPQYFQYDYTMASDKFTCTATGNLDADAVNSVFAMSGSVQTDGTQKVAVVAPNVEETNPDE